MSQVPLLLGTGLCRQRSGAESPLPARQYQCRTQTPSIPQLLHLSTAGRHWEMPPFPGDSSFDSTRAHSCNLRHLVLAKNAALVPVNAATLR